MLHQKYIPLIQEHKRMLDSVHKQIYLSNYAVLVIDTLIFQRMRDLSQVGLCQYIYPSAVHKRFIHSIGVYNIAKRMMHTIKKRSNPEHLSECLSNIEELKDSFDEKEIVMNDRIIELAGLAGLVHDLGHGSFSHLFDDRLVDALFMPESKHEYRSCTAFADIVNEINKEHEQIMINESELKLIQKIINPDKYCKGFIYEIVSNARNGIDVDKFDYVIRDSQSINQNFGFNWEIICDNVCVIDNTVCYLKQSISEIQSMFNARYKLHKQVYSHPKVLACEFMFVDMFEEICKIIDIEKIIKSEEFYKYTDSKIMSMILESENENIKRIYKRFIKRNLYKHIDTIILKPDYNPIPLELICQLIPEINKNDVIIYEKKIGYVNGKYNPLKNIYIYNKKNNQMKEKVTLGEIAGLAGQTFQEHNIFYFYKGTNEKIIDQFKILINEYKNLENSKAVNPLDLDRSKTS
jgi:HD superfamily phosphohydrolase